MEEFVSNSAEETLDIAKRIAGELDENDVVVLIGDLGSGKTKFVEGILEFWNLKEEISSPTFTIVNEYKNSKITIYHFDVYRLENEDEFYAIGGEEYFEKGLCLIEWGEIIKEAIPKKHIEISFSRDLVFEQRRIIKVKKYYE